MRYAVSVTVVRLGLFIAIVCPAQPVEREIASGEKHSYSVTAQAGDFLHVFAEQLNGDVTMTLRAPDGSRISALDRHAAPGIDDLPWIVTQEGVHKLEVGARASSSYRLRIEQRPTTEQDRRRASAFRESWIQAKRPADGLNAAERNALIKRYESALPDWRAAGDAGWEAFVLTELAYIEQRTGRLASARDRLLRAEELVREIPGEIRGLSIILNGLGSTFSSLGDHTQAVVYLEKVLALRRKLGARKEEGATLNNLGLALHRLGQTERAIEVFQQAIAIRREVADRSGEATTNSNLGSIAMYQGRLQDALRHHAEALRLRQEVKDRAGEGSSLGAIGTIYYSSGDYGKAEEYVRQSAAIADEFGDTNMLGSRLETLGMISARLGEFDKARSFLERAIEARRQAGSAPGIANALASLGITLTDAGKFDEAIARCRESLEVSRKTKVQTYIASAALCLGRAYIRNGNVDEGLAQMAEAELLYRSTNSFLHLMGVLVAQAEAALAKAAPRMAIDKVEEALSIGETSNSGVQDVNQRAAFRSRYASGIEFYVRALMQQNEAQAALDVIERYRARTLAETLTSTAAKQPPESATIVKAMTDIQRELFQAKPSELRRAELRRQLAHHERSLDLLRLQSAGHAQTVAAADVWNTARIQRELLREDDALLVYSLGSKQSYAWVVRKGSIASATLPPRKEIESGVEAIRIQLKTHVSSLTAANAIRAADKQAAELYKTLVAPIADSLRGAKQLIVSADGALAYLPFEVLTQANTRLIERFSISYVPSASILAAVRGRATDRKAPGKQLLAMGDPVYGSASEFVALPNTRAEVGAIERQFGPALARKHLGAAATERALKSEALADFRYIHLAAHGFLDDERPHRSGIVLAVAKDDTEDGILQADEVASLKLNANMVTLSACQTGLGRIIAGEGVLGLSRSFLTAGAQSLAVSLWSVNDAATAELMTNLYRNLNRGLSREQALRQAKLSMMRSPNAAWRHPYYWAPFVLSGDGR